MYILTMTGITIFVVSGDFKVVIDTRNTYKWYLDKLSLYKKNYKLLLLLFAIIINQ